MSTQVSTASQAQSNVEVDAHLINDDLAPAKERNWFFFSLFAMWMSDIYSIGGYTFAAGLFTFGLGVAHVLVGM